jgi:hypothetical protein
MASGSGFATGILTDGTMLLANLNRPTLLCHPWRRSHLLYYTAGRSKSDTVWCESFFSFISVAARRGQIRKTLNIVGIDADEI